MTDIKQDVKVFVKVFIQVFVSNIVKESTKKMIKSLSQRQRKLLESKSKTMSDDQIVQYLDKSSFFKKTLENSVKSVCDLSSSKGTVSLAGKLESIYETTGYFNNPIYGLILPGPKVIVAVAAGTILTTAAVSFAFVGSAPGANFPSANFSSNVTEGYAPVTVNFTDHSQNATEWYWDFGDGSNSFDKDPIHTYLKAGDYIVKLNVSNENDTDSINATINVYPKSEFPVARLSSNVTTGSTPLTVQFEDLSQNATEWNWDFGDETYSTDHNPVHTYLEAGSYTVNLTVTNVKGSDSNNATIKAFPVYAYITNGGSKNVSIIDIAKNKVIDSVKVESSPEGIAVSPDGTKVYVANLRSNTVSVIDTVARKVVETVKVGPKPNGVAVTPDGTKVYVTNYGTNTVSVINVSNNFFTSTVTVENNPFGVAITPDGTTAYVTNDKDKTISVIDTSKDIVKDTINLENQLPGGVAVNPAGTTVYVTSGPTNNVSVIDVATNNVTANVPVGKTPKGIAVTPDGTRVYVANFESDDVSVINTITNTVQTSVKVGKSPYGVSVTPDGSKVYVTNDHENSVSVIDTSTNNITATVNVGDLPKAFGQFIGALQN